MKYTAWLNKRMREINATTVILRMMSSGNDLIGLPPKYGIYFAETAREDKLTTQRDSGVYSAIGGGFIPTADVEFFVRPTTIGYWVRRQHEGNFRNGKFDDVKVFGFALTLKGADRVAYNQAKKTASNLSKMINARLVDRTGEDLSKFREHEAFLKLEDRVHDYSNRINC